MNLESLKSKLSESEYAELTSYVTTLVGQKDEARKESIEGRKSLKAEVEKLRGVKEKLFDKLGIDEDADLETVEVPTKQASIEATKQYEQKLKRMEKDLLTAKETYSALEGKHRSTLLDATLSKALSGHDFVDSELVTEYVKGRIKFEGEDFVFSDGDKSLSLVEGVKLLATTKPHLLKSQGTSGSGFNPNATAGKVKDFKSMTLTEKSELYKSNPEAYNTLKAA